MHKVKHETFNDGILYYGSIEPKMNSYKKKVGEIIKGKGFMFYKQLSARESDVIRCSSLGHSLDLKVKVLYRPNILATDKVTIDNLIYDIIEKDGESKTYLYLYLQKAGMKND